MELPGVQLRMTGRAPSYSVSGVLLRLLVEHKHSGLSESCMYHRITGLWVRDGCVHVCECVHLYTVTYVRSCGAASDVQGLCVIRTGHLIELRGEAYVPAI